MESAEAHLTAGAKWAVNVVPEGLVVDAAPGVVPAVGIHFGQHEDACKCLRQRCEFHGQMLIKALDHGGTGLEVDCYVLRVRMVEQFGDGVFVFAVVDGALGQGDPEALRVRL